MGGRKALKRLKRKYRAVIFDLFGTLVETWSRSAFEGFLVRAAGVLCAPPEEFARLWLATASHRMTGKFATTLANFEHICQVMSLPAETSRLREAARIRLDFTRDSLIWRHDALDTLTSLRASGKKTGLISDCSCEVPELWDSTPVAPLIDVAVFSCIVGIQKPDPHIYALACDRLRVPPEECLYVGDGDSRELTGAAEAGLHPVLLRAIDDRVADPYRLEAEEWEGTVIERLSEVVELVHG